MTGAGPPRPPHARSACSRPRPRSRPRAATTRCRCATSRPGPRSRSARSTATTRRRTSCCSRRWPQQAATLRERLVQRPPSGDTPAERVADVLRRASRALERAPRVTKAMLTAMSSPEDGDGPAEARDRLDAARDHRRRRRRRRTLHDVRRPRRHRARARLGVVRRAHLLEQRAERVGVDGRQPRDRGRAPARLTDADRLVSRFRRARTLAEDRRVVGVARVDRADDDPRRRRRRRTAAGDRRARRAPSSSGRASPPHVSVGVRARPRGRARPARANRSGSVAPRVPAVGERDDLAHLRGAPADPHRIAVARSGAHRVVQRGRRGRPSCRTRARTPRSRRGSASRRRRSPAISRPPLTRCAVANAVRERRGRPQRRARDERADADARRLRRDRAEQREALERGPAVRADRRATGGRTRTPRRGRRPRPRARPRSGSRDPRRTTAASARRGQSREQLAGEHRGADRAGALAELARARSGSSGRYAAPSMWRTNALAQRVEQQRPELDQAARDHDAAPGSSTFASAGEPERDVVGVLREQRDARRRRPRAPPPPTCTPVTASTSPPAAARIARAAARCDELARHAAERGARRDRLPVPALAARAQRAVALDREVTDLGAEAVRAAVHARRRAACRRRCRCRASRAARARAPVAAPYATSPSAATFASLSTTTRMPRRVARARRAAARRARSAGSASRARGRRGRRARPRRRRPARPAARARRRSRPRSRRARRRPACGDSAALLAQHRAVGVEQDAEHLRAADVEPDRRRRCAAAARRLLDIDAAQPRRARRRRASALLLEHDRVGRVDHGARVRPTNSSRGVPEVLDADRRARGVPQAVDRVARSPARRPRRRAAGRSQRRRAHTNSTSRRSPSKRAPPTSRRTRLSGSSERAPVRTDRHEQLLVGAAEPHVVALGERQVHREHERVADRVDAERLDVRQPRRDVEVAVEVLGERATRSSTPTSSSFGELGGRASAAARTRRRSTSRCADCVGLPLRRTTDGRARVGRMRFAITASTW